MIVRREETRTIWTVAELLKWTEGYFQRLGFPTPRLDAEILLALALSKTRIELYTGYQMLVEPDERARFRGLVERRARKEPVAYITRRREFFSLSFEVSPAVLVPRPETEHVVEAAIKTLRPLSQARALDVGTGSGCMAVALAVNVPGLLVDAVDLSSQALEVARCNAQAHHVADRVRFLCGDVLAALPADAGPYQVIASNPPYVSAMEYEKLMEDVRLYEPKLALLDTRSESQDGLGFYRALAAGAGAWLEPAGVITVEVGAGQAGAVRDLFESQGFLHRETLRDLAGIERVVVMATR